MQINGKEIFEKSGLMFNLSRMASLEYQDKYLVHATAKYYEDPSEMADILYTECKNARYYVANATNFYKIIR